MKDESIMSLKVTNGEIIHHSALSVRDYFAAIAMGAITSKPEWEMMPVEKVSAWAYEQADAMLKERAK